MGSVFFIHSSICETAREGFISLCNDARNEYGFQGGYSGTIADTNLSSVKKLADKYTSTMDKKVKKMISDTKDTLYKRNCYCYDLGVVEYQIITIKKEKAKDSTPPKFKTKFVVYEECEFNDKKVKDFDSKTDADSLAMKKSLSSNHYFFVKKEPILIEGNDVVTLIKKETKTTKTKPKTIKANQKVREIHKYVYYGYAPE